MKVITKLEKPLQLPHPVISMGTFDGIHKGHRQIVQTLKEEAKKSGGTSLVISFWPHPRKVLFPERQDLFLLNTEEEKIALLEESGIDYLVILPFTTEFSELSAEEFIQQYLIGKFQVEKLIIGREHQFGRKREGNHNNILELSQKYHFECIEIPEYLEQEVDVSSTKIRNALMAGDIETATLHLGYTYSILGTVVDGKKLGRTLGFPTANLVVETPEKLIPGIGVYAVKVAVGAEMFEGMMSIGVRPTFDFNEMTLEVHLFHFNRDIYHQAIRVYFIAWLRPELKFNEVSELVRQIEQDKQDSLRILSKTPDVTI